MSPVDADLPLDLVGEAVGRLTTEGFIARYGAPLPPSALKKRKKA